MVCAIIKRNNALFLLILITFLRPATAQAAKLTTSQKFESLYLIKPSSLRHNKLTLSLRYEADLTDAWSFVTDGLVSYDAALANCAQCTQKDLPDNVRRDELYQDDLRELHVTYSGDHARARVGRIKFDWIDSIFPQSSDFVTAVDLRGGGYGEMGDVIIPTEAFDLTHDFVADSRLEWMIARPTESRLPKGPNGYGFYEYFADSLPDRELEIKNNRVPRTWNQAEYGVRWMRSAPSADFSLFAYRGHNRIPNIMIQPALSQTKTGVDFTYDRLTTYGATVTKTMSDDTVGRMFSYLEPDRAPALVVLRPSGASRSSGSTRRYRVGIGLDHVLTDRLRVYSDAYMTRIEKTSQGDLTSAYQSYDKNHRDYNLNYRISYDLVEQTKMILDGMCTGPERSFLVSPQIAAPIFDDYTLAAGARYVKSYSDQSQLDLLRDTSHVFLTLERRTASAR